MNESPFEIDHVFVAVARGASEVDELQALGFEEGPMNVHHGQGTACRRLFFENVYLELLWQEPEAPTAAAAIERTGLAARAGLHEGASRLGLALRPRGSTGEPLPVDTWDYEAPYLDGRMAIPMACNSTRLGEPLLFFMPWERQWSAPRIPHPNGARQVTEISVIVEEGRTHSPEMRWLRQWPGVAIEGGASERLRIELDQGRRGRSLSLSPAAPLEVRW